MQAFVEWYASYQYHGGIPAELSSVIDVAWVQLAAGIVHAARLSLACTASTLPSPHYNSSRG